MKPLTEINGVELLNQNTLEPLRKEVARAEARLVEMESSAEGWRFWGDARPHLAAIEKAKQELAVAERDQIALMKYLECGRVVEV